MAEKLKEEIGSLYKNDASNTEVYGVDVNTGESKCIVVESQVIYDAVVGFYERISASIQAIISSCPENIIEDIQNLGIYVMGGSSLISGAEQYFRRKLNLPVMVADETTAVDVLGAGKLLSEPRLLKILSEL